MFLKINVLPVLITLQLCELLCDQAGASGAVRNTGGVEPYKESGAVSGERGERLETQDLSQDGPLALQGDNNPDYSVHGRRKRCQENEKEACPSCTTPKGGKHRREEENSANLCPTFLENGEINGKSNEQNVCPSCPSHVEKNADKPSDGNVCPTCLAPIAQNESDGPTGSLQEKRVDQDVDSDIQSVRFSDQDVAMNQAKDSQVQSEAGQKVCPACATLLEDDFAVCPSCLAASTLNRLSKREARRAVHFGRHQKPLDHHNAHKRQNRDEHKYRRSPRPRRSHKLNVHKRKTANDFNGVSVESIIDKDREDDLYQSFGRLLDKDDEPGFDARSRIRTHRLTGLTDHSGEIVKEDADADEKEARGADLTADEGDAPGYKHSVARAKSIRL